MLLPVFKYTLRSRKSMKKNKQNGFSSLEVLVTLFVLSLLLIAFLYIFSFYQLSVTKEKLKNDSKTNIENTFSSLIQTFKEKVNPECDGPNDEVYQITTDDKTECEIQIKPLSHLIDLNFLPSDFYTTEYFLSLLKENTAPTFIQETRKNGTLITSYSDIEEFIEEEKFNESITIHSTANINIVDEDSLNTLCTLYDVQSDIVNKRKSLIKNKQFVSTETEALLAYGITYQFFYPYVNVQPILNVNFIDENFLKALVTLPRFKLASAEKKCNNLIAIRNANTVNTETICNTFGITKSHELYYYLGCNTYFWEILISNKSVSCKYLVFKDDKNFYLLGKKWL